MISTLSHGRGRYAVLAIAALLMFGAIGCTATVEPTTPTPVSPVTTPAPTTQPPAGAPAAMQEKKVILTNGQVTLEKSTFDAGKVRFMVKNDGGVVHALELVGEGIDQRTPDLQPGESAVLDVTLTAGEYEAYCPVNGHRERGMTTTFMVK